MEVVDSKAFTCGANGTVQMTDLLAETTSIIYTHPAKSPLWCLNIHIESRQIAIGSQFGQVIVLYMDHEWSQVLKMMDSLKVRGGLWDINFIGASEIAISSDFPLLIDPPNSKVRSIPSHAISPPHEKVRDLIGHVGHVRSLHSLSDEILVTAGDKQMMGWEWETSKRLWEIDVGEGRIYDIAVIGNKIVTAISVSGRTTDDYAVLRVWRFIHGMPYFICDIELGQSDRIFSISATNDHIFCCSSVKLTHIYLGSLPKSKATVMQKVYSKMFG